MKEFDKWNEVKKELEKDSVSFGYKNRDIFYIKMGQNIGFEQNGKGDSLSTNIALLSQMRLFSSKRLLNKIGVMDKESFEKMKEKFKKLVD